MKKLMSALVAFMFSAILMAGGNIAPIAQVAPDSDSTIGMYVGAGVGSSWTYHKGDFDFASDKAGKSYVDPLTGIKVGYEFYRDGSIGVAIEGRMLASINADDFDTSIYSAYLKPEYYFGEYPIGVYGLIGASHVRYNDGSDSESHNGFSFGLGAEYQITKRISVSADWTSNLWNKDALGGKDINNDVAMVWVNFKF
jgi:opacity protein-like surface antigen